MTILFNEAQPIPIHAIAAMIAVIMGAVQLVSQKGGKIHKLMGRAWVALMASVSISSFFIHEIKLWGAFSPIHLLSIWTLICLGVGIYFARTVNITGHKIFMTSLYIFALIITGLFTLMPGRVMHQIIFG